MKRIVAARVTPWVVLAGLALAVSAAFHRGGGVEKADLVAQAGLDDAEAAAASTYDLLVDFRDDSGPEVLAATPFAEEAISSYTAIDKLYRIRFDDHASALAAARVLASNPAVESLEWDVPVFLPRDNDDGVAARSPFPTARCEAGASTTGFPNDPCFRYQWNLHQIGVPQAWALGQGKGVVVAVLDTGVSPVPDLGGIELVGGSNFVVAGGTTTDDHGHGTHVAGTIAQATNNGLGVAGVAYRARIMPLKVLDATGVGTAGGVIQAIKYAADNGAKVLNMSLGGPFPAWGLHGAMKYARSKGVFVVAAAGNNGGRVDYPGRYPEVFTVSATRFDETRTFYSSHGTGVDIAAPGGDLRVDQNGDGQPDGILQNTVTPGNTALVDYIFLNGTSMAAPHVAGVAALVVGAGVTEPDAIAALLRGTARPPRLPAGVNLDAKKLKDAYGAGIADAHAALTRHQVVRGAGGLGLGGGLALVALLGLRRRGQLARLGPGFLAAFTLGAAGLFFLPLFVPLPGPLAALAVGAPEIVPTLLGGFGQGSPFFYGAFIPFAAVALLAGVPRLRGVLGGLAFGVGGALAVAAVLGAMNVTFMPDTLDRLWLLANAAACTVLGRFVMRR